MNAARSPERGTLSSRHAIANFMTPSPHSVGRDQTLATAYAMMKRHHVRHLPVLEGGKLAGVLSERDVYFVESIGGVELSTVRVEEAMSQDTYAVHPDTNVDVVAVEMADHKYGCAVVLQQDKVLGIFTTTDALRALARQSSTSSNVIPFAAGSTAIKNILVATDFSDVSDNAVAYTVALARQLKARVTLLHAYQIPVHGTSDESDLASTDLARKAFGDATSALLAQARQVENAGIPITTELRSGSPIDAVEQVATLVNADLVIVGTRGEALGTVAESVICTSTRPVLAVHAPPASLR